MVYDLAKESVDKHKTSALAETETPITIKCTKNYNCLENNIKDLISTHC